MTDGDVVKIKSLPLTVGILIFHEVEVLDVAGPFEVSLKLGCTKSDGGKSLLHFESY